MSFTVPDTMRRALMTHSAQLDPSRILEIDADRMLFNVDHSAVTSHPVPVADNLDNPGRLLLISGLFCVRHLDMDDTEGGVSGVSRIEKVTMIPYI